MVNRGDARALAPWQVRRVTSFMQRHLAKQITLQELADLLGLSRAYLCTAFRLTTGYTPHAFLVQLRMDEARRLLRSQLRTLSTVCAPSQVVMRERGGPLRWPRDGRASRPCENPG